MHSMILGEIACGNIKNRDEILTLLSQLPGVEELSNREVIRFIEQRNLSGKGLGFIDMHLLASAILSQAELFTMDHRLGQMWKKIRIA